MRQDNQLKREQASILTVPERHLLRFLAPRVPGGVSPDHLTILGVFGAFLVLVGYLLSSQTVQWLWLANLGLLVNWFGDSLDGTVARLRGIERPNYGYYIDQTIDTFSNLLIALGVGLSAYFRLDIALLALASYHMLSIHVFVRSVLTREFTLDVSGLGPTELRVGILSANVGILVFGAPAWQAFGISFTWCDILAMSAFFLMLALFAAEVRREAARQLAKDEGTP